VSPRKLWIAPTCLEAYVYSKDHTGHGMMMNRIYAQTYSSIDTAHFEYKQLDTDPVLDPFQ
jgi:hypothetical protein